MTLEERVAKLESFIGNMDRISSVYANSLQEICDKYLSLLYIETPSVETNKLVIDGWLGDIDIDKLPKNTIINVRASHTFDMPEETSASKIVFKRDNTYVELPLKKYDALHPGNLVFLEPGDYIQGIVYDIYINSQNIAIISSSDTGNVALQVCTELRMAIEDLKGNFDGLANTVTTNTLNATKAVTQDLAVLNRASFTKPLTLPTGSTCSVPQADSEIANRTFVEDRIKAAINEYHNKYHIFGVGDPTQALNNAPDKAIYYRYK